MGERIVDNRLNLIPNESVSIFKLGDDIRKYFHLEYEYFNDNDSIVPYEAYYFFYIPISVWVDTETHRLIETIRCSESCIYNNHELIGMNYSDFIHIFNLVPDDIDSLWSYGPKKNDRKYTVYDFDKLGLMLWVWRGKIRTVLISKYEPDEEEE